MDATQASSTDRGEPYATDERFVLTFDRYDVDSRGVETVDIRGEIVVPARNGGVDDPQAREEVGFIARSLRDLGWEWFRLEFKYHDTFFGREDGCNGVTLQWDESIAEWIVDSPWHDTCEPVLIANFADKIKRRRECPSCGHVVIEKVEG